MLVKNDTSIVNMKNEEGKTCLHVCASRPRNTRQLKLLLTEYIGKVVIDVDAEDNKGNTALMMAADHGAYEALKWLTDAGADRTKLNHDNKNAFDYIRRVGSQMRFFDYVSKKSNNKLFKLEQMKVGERSDGHLASSRPHPLCTYCRHVLAKANENKLFFQLIQIDGKIEPIKQPTTEQPSKQSVGQPTESIEPTGSQTESDGAAFSEDWEESVDSARGDTSAREKRKEKEPMFKSGIETAIREWLTADKSLATAKDVNGRVAKDVASKPMRKVSGSLLTLLVIPPHDEGCCPALLLRRSSNPWYSSVAATISSRAPRSTGQPHRWSWSLTTSA